MKKIKVLQIGMTANLGGIEKYLIELYRHIDKDSIKMDFLVFEDNICFSDEIDKKNIIKLQPRGKSYFKFIKQLKKFYKESNYNYIHVNLMSFSFFEPILLAKKYTKSKIVLHSHVANNTALSGITKILDRIGLLFIKHKDNSLKFACSKDAGDSLFRSFKNNNFYVANNGIEIEKFLYSEHSRRVIREELRIRDDEILLGNVGRVEKEKNQIFIVGLLEKLEDKYKLLIIGKGSEKDKIIKEAQSKGVLSRIIFVQDINNVGDYLCAMDIFLFPSLYEGLGIALVEAQAAGLKCVINNSLPVEVNLTENIVRCSLKERVWLENIHRIDCSYQRKIEVGSFKKFDIKESAMDVVNVYKENLIKEDYCLVTITGNENMGNKLQNFALQEYLRKKNVYVKTVWNRGNLTFNCARKLKRIILSLKSNEKKLFYRREKIIKKFTDDFLKVAYIKNTEDLKKYNFKHAVIGSDQIWNPNVVKSNGLGISILDMGMKVCSYSSSFGVSDIDDDYKNKIKNLFQEKNIKYLSVREDKGKEIIEDCTGRTDVEVLVDPTMLLTAAEWDEISKKPEQLGNEKYILNYFLGKLSDERKKEIERIAEENNCRVINILDPNDPFYVCGPSEFLYLEKNAFLICTDSFHSSVFAILYDRPFIVFDREQEGLEKMNSRIDTLINKFNLKNRRFTGKITRENLEHDYSEAYKILEDEREKSDKFLRNALDIKE